MALVYTASYDDVMFIHIVKNQLKYLKSVSQPPLCFILNLLYGSILHCIVLSFIIYTTNNSNRLEPAVNILLQRIAF